jgi:hypothetical protein
MACKVLQNLSILRNELCVRKLALGGQLLYASHDPCDTRRRTFSAASSRIGLGRGQDPAFIRFAKDEKVREDALKTCWW